MAGMHDRFDTADGEPHEVTVLIITTPGVGVTTVDVHRHADEAVSSAVRLFDIENDSTGKFLDEVERAAARERFRRSLVRQRAIDIGGVKVQLATRRVT